MKRNKKFTNFIKIAIRIFYQKYHFTYVYYNKQNSYYIYINIHFNNFEYLSKQFILHNATTDYLKLYFTNIFSTYQVDNKKFYNYKN